MNSTKRSCLTFNWYRPTATWRTSSKHNVVLNSGPLAHGMNSRRHPQNRKYITHRNAVRGGRESRPQATRTKNLVKFGCWAIFELCERTDKQTNRHTHYNTLHPSRGEVKIRVFWRILLSVGPFVTTKGLSLLITDRSQRCRGRRWRTLRRRTAAPGWLASRCSRTVWSRWPWRERREHSVPRPASAGLWAQFHTRSTRTAIHLTVSVCLHTSGHNVYTCRVGGASPGETVWIHAPRKKQYHAARLRPLH